MANLTIRFKSGYTVFNTETEEHTNYSGFKAAVKKFFQDWMNQQQDDTYQMYHGSFEEMNGGSYVDYAGAIQEAINEIEIAATEEFESKGRKVTTSAEWYKWNIDGVFEP